MADSIVMGLNGAPPAISGAVTQRIYAVGTYTQALGVASQVVSVPGMLSTAVVVLTVNQVDVTMLTVVAVPAANQFTSVAVAPTAGCKVSYIVFQ